MRVGPTSGPKGADIVASSVPVKRLGPPSSSSALSTMKKSPPKDWTASDVGEWLVRMDKLYSESDTTLKGSISQHKTVFLQQEVSGELVTDRFFFFYSL